MLLYKALSLQITSSNWPLNLSVIVRESAAKFDVNTHKQLDTFDIAATTYTAHHLRNVRYLNNLCSIFNECARELALTLIEIEFTELTT